MIEQAKGILMARHAIDADTAFTMLRDHSQHNGHRLADIAAGIANSHLLLQPPIAEPATAEHREISAGIALRRAPDSSIEHVSYRWATIPSIAFVRDPNNRYRAESPSSAE